MSVALLLRCDVPGCKAYADLLDGESVHTARGRLAAFGWWVLASARTEPAVLDLCPTHAAVTPRVAP